MEMTTGEVVDRFTILIMKSEFCLESKKECEIYLSEIISLFEKMKDQGKKMCFISLVMKLMAINSKIWVTESSIRKEFKEDISSQEEELSLEEIGKRAIQIRDYNKTRVALKNEINTMFGSFCDKKVNHQSS